VIPDRLDGSNHPFGATRQKRESYQCTRLKSHELLGALYRKGHLHGRHETRNRTVVQGHYAFGLVECHHAALSLETGFGMRGDYGQMQVPAEGGRNQQSTPRMRARIVHC
jgi:hypothetical protein